MFKIILILFLSLTISCSGKRAFTKGEYTDPDQVIHLDDRFNESDMKNMVDPLVDSLVSHNVFNTGKAPVVYTSLVVNSTSEHIDMKAMTDKIRTAMLKTGKVQFHDKDQRKTMSDEYQYQSSSGYVDAKTAISKGYQIGTDYLISGELSSHIQRLGAKEVIYYKLTLNLTDIKTGLIVWSDEKELKKLFKKRSYAI